MTRDEIIRMARDAYGDWFPNTPAPQELERFAALVTAAEQQRLQLKFAKDLYEQGMKNIARVYYEINQARREEREACAQVCEGHYDTAQAARAIRARGET